MASVGPGGANTSEGVLANFFNSLLSKKTAQPGSPGNQIKPTTGLDDCEYTYTKKNLINNVENSRWMVLFTVVFNEA